MRVLRNLSNLPSNSRGAAIALGNFDGVHQGHQAVISATVDISKNMQVPAGVLTFEPHPRNLFRPLDPTFRLTNFRAKAVRLGEAGVDLLYIARFNKLFASQSAKDFVKNILLNDLGASHIIAGYDFVFGKNREGDVDLLKKLSSEIGLGLSIVSPVDGGEDNKPFSSETIRAALRDGDPMSAAFSLGYWWEISGRVRAGSARGKKFGYPTANFPLGSWLHPRFGIYAVHVFIEGDQTWRPGVASVGIRPMFKSQYPILEAHLFDFDENLYGKLIRVALVEFLRPEAEFKSIDALLEAMEEDSKRAQKILESPKGASDRFSIWSSST